MIRVHGAPWLDMWGHGGAEEVTRIVPESSNYLVKYVRWNKAVSWERDRNGGIPGETTEF